MKKILISLAGVAALSCSMTASAVDLAPATSNSVTTATCTLLDEDVSINISKDVYGSVICDATANGIGVATCHIAGLKTATDTFGNVYSVSSLGGSIATDATAVCTAASHGNVVTVATAASTGS